jgi:hypothetical protein
LLDWKRTLERDALREKLALQARGRKLEETLAELSFARRSIPEGSGQPSGAERVAELSQWSAYAELLRGRERATFQDLAELRGQLFAQAKEHEARRREVEGLERLEAREALRRKKARAKREQELIDEAASRRKLP